MEKNKIAVVMLTMAALGAHSAAGAATEDSNKCSSISSSNPTSIAPARQMKVIYGPYNVKCTKGTHSFRIAGAPANPRAFIQQLSTGGWTSVTSSSASPSGSFGAGTFRLVLDNTHYNNIQSYSVSYSIPR